MSKIKDDDLYSYATVSFESHGFIIQAHEDYMYKIKVDPIGPHRSTIGLELQIGTDGKGYSMNILVGAENIDVLIRDHRAPNRFNSYIMVYRSGKSEAEVFEMIRPQLRDVMLQHAVAYQLLTDNTNEMAYVLGLGPLDGGNYLCTTAPGNLKTSF